MTGFEMKVLMNLESTVTLFYLYIHIISCISFTLNIAIFLVFFPGLHKYMITNYLCRTVQKTDKF